MNVFFTIILIASLALTLYDSPNTALTSMLAGLEKSLAFALTLFASYGIWMSVLKIWELCGLSKKTSLLLTPIAQKLFPKERAEVYTLLSLNLSANILGMGGATTPSGKRATELMTHDKNRIMLAVINGTSIQVLPTTIIAMRASAGATTDIVLPTIIASLCSTTIGVLMVKLLVRENPDKNKIYLEKLLHENVKLTLGKFGKFSHGKLAP